MDNKTNMTVVERGKNRNSFDTGMPYSFMPFILTGIGTLFLVLGLFVMIKEWPFSSGDDALFVSIMCVVVGGIGLVVGIVSFIRNSKY